MTTRKATKTATANATARATTKTKQNTGILSCAQNDGGLAFSGSFD
jgi:hypothetical protein